MQGFLCLWRTFFLLHFVLLIYFSTISCGTPPAHTVGRAQRRWQIQYVVVIVSLKPLAIFPASCSLDLVDDSPLDQNFNHAPRRVLRASAVQRDDLHAGSAHILLSRAADQIAVHSDPDGR